MNKLLASYVLGESLTALPFGDVLEATHAARQEPLAVLILADELARNHRLRGLLRLEIARAGGLRHPAIARPLEVGDQDGRLYVVYERPPGETLAELLETSRAITPAGAAAIVDRLAGGLDAAGARRIAHGALGPSGIIVGPNGAAALIGVGVLAAVDEAGLSEICRSRLDPAYLAPEQVAGRLAVASADAFALGRICETLLTAAARAGEPLPTTLSAVLDRQSRPDQASRYRTCRELAAALTARIGPSEIASGAPAATPSPASGPRPMPTPGNARSAARAEAATPAPASASARISTAVVGRASAPESTPPPIPRRLSPPPSAPHDDSVGAAELPMRSRAATPGRTAVRDASDAEPGSPAQTIAPADSSVQREGAPGADAPTVATPAAEPYRAGLIWKSRGRSRVAEVPATPAMRACIDQAFVESLPKLALRAAVPVGVALIVLGLGFVPVVFGLFIVAITTLSSGTVGALIHTLGLLSAKRHPSVVRVIGPMRAREREIRSKNSRTVERHLDVGDYDEIAIDESTYYEIGHAVAFSHEIELPWPTPPEDSSCYEMDAAIVTYSQTMSRLVFDVRHPDGARIWRHHGYDDAAWNASAP